MAIVLDHRSTALTEIKMAKRLRTANLEFQYGIFQESGHCNGVRVEVQENSLLVQFYIFSLRIAVIGWCRYLSESESF